MPDLTLRKQFKLLFIIPLLLATLYSVTALAACNCGSTNANSPCTGNTISTVVAGDSRSVTFNWAFNSDSLGARCGQFANGDYWVAPAVGKSDVTFTSVTGVGGELFVDENPTPESMGFLGVSYFHRVNSRLSVTNRVDAENIQPNLPKTYGNNTSLVAAIERDQSANGGCGTRAILGGCIDAYHVVTVLDAVPENAGATVLRPNVIRPSKDLMSLSQFNLTRLPKKSYFDGTNTEGLESIRRTWAHHLEILSMRDREKRSYSEGGRAFRADLVTDDYAATVAAQWHHDLTKLMSSDHTMAEITPALASMLTYAKDIYYHVYTFDGTRDRWFGVGAGQSIGRFPAVAFFAAMANDDKFGNAIKTASTTQVNLGGHSVHELDQVNLGPNGPVWGDGDANVALNLNNVGRYWSEMLTGQEFNGARHRDVGKKTGQRTLRDPYGYIDGPGQLPGISYAGVTAGPIRAFAAQMLLMPRMCEFVNYDPLVEYSLRLTSVGKQVDNDPCAPPDPRELNAGIISKLRAANVPGADSLVSCDTFRAKNCKYYGLSWDPELTDAPTWGPDPADRTRCIVNGTDPLDGSLQTGRFTDIPADSRSINIGYRVLPIESNWAAIHEGRSSCRTVIRANPKPPIDFQVIAQ